MTVPFLTTNVALLKSCRVVVDGAGGSDGVYNLSVSCPPTFAPTIAPTTPAPTVYTPPTPDVVGTLTCDMVATGNTTGANNTVEEPAPENWWMFTASEGGLYTFDSCGSQYDT